MFKKSIVILIFICYLNNSVAGLSDHFVITIKTDNPGSSSNTEFTIPVTGTGYDYGIDTNNDGTPEFPNVFSGITLSFPNPGTYTIRIAGDFPRIYFNNSGDKEKIIAIEQWGTIAWSSMNGSFYGASNLVNNATDTPHLSNVSSLFKMFEGATNLGNGTGNWNWDTSNIAGMSRTFSNATSFDEDLSSWNIEGVTNLGGMFTNVTLSEANYDALLTAWANQNVQSNISFNAGNSQFCSQNAIDAKNTLINTYNWSINDGSLNADCDQTNSFIFRVKTDNPGSSNDNQFTLPLSFSGSYNYDLDTNDDGKFDTFGLTGADGNQTITYSTVGTYTIRLRGQFPRIYFNNTGDKDKMISIEQWGNIQWSSMYQAFRGASNLVINSLDIPDLSQATDMSGMFDGASNLGNGSGNWDWNTSTIENMHSLFREATVFNKVEINNWDVTLVENLQYTFEGATSFNQSLSNWDTSNVIYFSGMFKDAVAFNQPLTQWSITSATTLRSMFDGATNFNGSLIGWNSSNVTDLSFMFRDATNFNQPLNHFNVEKVLDMGSMFINAVNYNQALSSWNTSMVESMGSMFWNSGFDQDISSWNFESVTESGFNFGLANMFLHSELSDGNYDKLLISLETQNIESGLFFHGGSSQYCSDNAVTARQNLMDNDLMVITDGGYNADCDSTDRFVFTVKTDNPGTSSNNQFTIPALASSISLDYDIDIDSDGIFDVFDVNDAYTITYLSAGTYQITIKNSFPRMAFLNDGDKDKMISIDHWGTNQWRALNDAFHGASNLIINATDAPNLESISSLHGMFKGASNIGNGSGNWNWDTSNISLISSMFEGASAFNKDVSNWNVENVTSFASMFKNASSFNQSINAWNLQSATIMNSMFEGATAFNQPLNNWNMTAVENISSIFKNASAFNQALNNWSTDSLTSIDSMFHSASNFNQPIDNFNLSSVTNMSLLFNDALNFNQPLNNWDTSNVTSMSNLFTGASSFNQPLDMWDTSKVTNFLNVFRDSKFNQDISVWDFGSATSLFGFLNGNSSFSTENYDQLLISFDSQLTTQFIDFDGGSAQYCSQEATDAKERLITNLNWAIEDAGRDPNCGVDLDSFIFTIKTDNTGFSNNNQFSIPTAASGFYGYDIDYDNDGVFDAFNINGDHIITYPNAGTYTIKINGTFPMIYFNNDGDRNKIISIDQWGTNSWLSFENSFSGCENLVINATDVPNLSLVNSLSGMFNNAENVGKEDEPSQWNWDTEFVKTMDKMFSGATNFNKDISSWDVGSVENMSEIFKNASGFNQAIGNWDTGKVTDFSSMFENASLFDQDLSGINFETGVSFIDMFKNITLSNHHYDSLLIALDQQTLNSSLSFNGGNSQYCSQEATDARQSLIDNDLWTVTDAGRNTICINNSIDITLITTKSAMYLNSGDELTVTVEITNSADVDINNAIFTAQEPLNIASLNWICSSVGGANCENNSGTGDISEQINIAANSGDKLIYEITILLSNHDFDELNYNLDVEEDITQIDINPNDNSEELSVIINELIFKNGFE